MATFETTRMDVIDLDPAEYIRLREEHPEEITSAQIVPPVLGKSKDFGKIRVKLSKPRYEVRL